MELTTLEKSLFIELAQDAKHWNGSPLWNQANDKTLSDNAVLGSLVKKGLVTTDEDEVLIGFSRRGKPMHRKNQFVSFTTAGMELAKTFSELTYDDLEGMKSE